MRLLSFRRALLVTLFFAVLTPATASAAPRMWVGFQDDASFRWVDNRSQLLDRAAEANATVIRTTVYWSKAAPTRPANAANPFDPAYVLDDLDEFVRGAQQRGIEVMLTIWGTPKWAGPAANQLPRRLADFQNFTRALAARYSGRYSDYPHVRFFTIWNEPNRGIFLSPQFDKRGRSVAHVNYAKLVRAGYAGIKAGNRQAVVGIGETASNGRDRKVARVDRQDTHSPGKFAELLGKLRPRVKFDAWAHHPYPTSPSMSPTQKMRWPNVSLASMPTFEKSLDTWFGRKKVPVWITEYGHETKPDKRGISTAKQRAYLAQAFTIARKDARVQMFIWFILNDRKTVPWESGLLTATGAKKPAFATFAALASRVDARNAVVEVSGANPLVRFSVLPMGRYGGVGTPVGVAYQVWQAGSVIAGDVPLLTLDADGWVSLRPTFTPLRGNTYTLTIRANHESGVVVYRTITLVAASFSTRR
jgi:aryl-phospho-beta-D-glucosidase BglC (GH1 family)